MNELDEPFRPGELVTLRDAPAEPRGRIVSVEAGGEHVEVAWHKFPGLEHEVTLEPTTALRRVHESELDASAE
jgi:hypothetical protein